MKSPTTMYSTNEEPVTLGELLLRRVTHSRQHVAFTFIEDGTETRTHITYAQLHRRALVLANKLRALDVRSPVLLVHPPGLEFISSFFGCLYAGLIPVPLPEPYSRRDAARFRAVVEDSRARFAIGSRRRIEKFGPSGSCESLIWIDGTVDDSDRTLEWAYQLVRRDDVAYIQYTSGSTNTPRGVMITHANVLSNLRFIDEAGSHSCDSVGVSWLPHFHDMGLVYGILEPLYRGFRSILLSPRFFLNRPGCWLEAISHFGGTHSGAPDFAYRLCAQQVNTINLNGLDLTSWRVAVNGAERVRKATVETFTETFKRCGFSASAFRPAYGLAEATLLVACHREGRPALTIDVDQQRVVDTSPEIPSDLQAGSQRIMSSGVVAGTLDVRIARPGTDEVCTEGEVGEVFVSGPSVGRGYWNRKEESEITFHARIPGLNRDYLRTGDLGLIWRDELYIVGRLKDIIIIRGTNHYPEDIESTIEQSYSPTHRYACAAFSVDNGEQEQLIIALEAPRRDREFFDGIASSIRDTVAKNHAIQVSTVALLPPGKLPRTSSGKLQRSECRNQYLAGVWAQFCHSSLLERPASKQLRAALENFGRIVGEVLGIDSNDIEADRPLTFYGLDSFSATRLSWRLEQELGISWTASSLLDSTTVRGLLESPQLEQDPVLNLKPRDSSQSQDSSVLLLSSEQERLWWLRKIDPDASSQHVSVALTLNGMLDKEVLRRCLNQLVLRHELLRTAIVDINGEPRRNLIESATIELSDTGNSLAEARQSDRFDLNRPPLLRAQLLTVNPEEFILLLTGHHLIADANSMLILGQEVLELYAAAICGTQASFRLPASEYSEFVSLERRYRSEMSLDTDLLYWNQQLDGVSTRLTWCAASPSPAMQPRPSKATVSEDEAAAIRAYSRQLNGTPFMFYLSALACVVARLSDARDFILWAPVSGRLTPEFEHTVGVFAHPLPIRIRLREGETFSTLVKQVCRTVLDAFAHQKTPLSSMMQAHASKQKEPIRLQVLLNCLRAPSLSAPASELRAEWHDFFEGPSDVELSLTIVESDAGAHWYLQSGGANSPVQRSTVIAAQLKSTIEQALVSGDSALDLSPMDYGPGPSCLIVCSSFRSDPLEAPLRFWMERLQSLPSAVRFTPYGQVIQQLLDSSGLIRQNSNGINVIAFRIEDWTPRSAGRFSKTDRTYFIDSLRAATNSSRTPYVVCICPPSPAYLEAVGGYELYATDESDLSEAIQKMPGVYSIKSSEMLRLYPIRDYYDSYAEEHADLPFTPSFLTALATMIARRCHTLSKPQRKVVVLDCDNTLWTGICAEDGVDGIRIDHPRLMLQSFMRDRVESGMLLCLASKNNYTDVADVFGKKSEMLLEWRHIAAHRINWDSKAANLCALASELQIDLQDFVFIDDSPAECEEVRREYPNVLTLQLPSQPEDIPKFLDHVWDLDMLKVTHEDGFRTKWYQEASKRVELERRSPSLDEFIRTLDLKVTITQASEENLERVSELTQRTNQFNASGKRRTVGELRHLVKTGFSCSVVRASDRFGDYGIVGVMLYRPSERTVEVDTFLLSCRALGKGVEREMLANLMRYASQEDLEAVEIRFIGTARNTPARLFLQTAQESAIPEGFVDVVVSVRADGGSMQGWNGGEGT